MIKLNHSALAPNCILPPQVTSAGEGGRKGASSLHVFSVWIPSDVAGALKSSPRWIICLHRSFTSHWRPSRPFCGQRWRDGTPYWEEPGSRRQPEPLTRRGQRELTISKLYMCFVFGIIPPDASLLNSCSSLRWFCFCALWSCD